MKNLAIPELPDSVVRNSLNPDDNRANVSSAEKKRKGNSKTRPDYGEALTTMAEVGSFFCSGFSCWSLLCIHTLSFLVFFWQASAKKANIAKDAFTERKKSAKLENIALSVKFQQDTTDLIENLSRAYARAKEALASGNHDEDGKALLRQQVELYKRKISEAMSAH